MRIMLTGSEAGAVDTVSRSLAAAGHEVVNVLDLANTMLPLEPAAFDVALCVRAHPLPTLTRFETCLHGVLAAGTPLIIAGAGVAHPLLDRADDQVIDLDAAAIADAVDRAVARRLVTAAGSLETTC